MTDTTENARWSCPPWCQHDHEDGRVDAAAGVFHSRTLTTIELPAIPELRDGPGEPAVIGVEQYVNEDAVHPLLVTIHTGASAEGGLTPTEARALATAVTEAADFAATPPSE